MTATGEAPGKVILVGEHAVVYGRPAIAVPVWETRATASITPRALGAGCLLRAHELNREIVLANAGEHEALALVTRLALHELSLPSNPDWVIDVRSQIPIASGMGSGAAVSAAVVRAIFRQAGLVPDDAVVSDLVYSSEEVHHGTPSGIDNTVVSYGRPVWFVRGKAPEIFSPARPFALAIADSGVPSSTLAMVAGVRSRRDAAPQQYDEWFDEIAEIAVDARLAIESGDTRGLGPLFSRNQRLLEKIGVSTQELEKMVDAALRAGAGGAKLSGGGGGGNVISLVTPETSRKVTNALTAAGAKRVVVTAVGAAD